MGSNSNRLLWALFLILLLADPTGCTNMQIGQSAQRYSDNTAGNLAGHGDFTPTNPNQFTFSAFGDSHIGSSGGDLLLTALQRSKAQGDQFAISLGDNSNTGQESELMTFLSQTQTAGMTVYPVIGNHDIFFGGWSNYKSILGKSMYSFNAGVVHFIALDTANGVIGENQLNWLNADLQANTRPVKIVLMHYPAYIREFSSPFKLSSDEEITILKNLFHNFGVQLVLAGHYHGFADSTIGGVRYVVDGACNHILDPGNNSSYLQISINGSSVGVTQVQL